MNHSVNFKGVWIPAEIWLADELSLQEKIILAEIDKLDNDSGCYATNQYFANFIRLSKKRVSVIVNDLVSKGFIESKFISKNSNNKEVIRIIRVCKGRYPVKEPGGMLVNEDIHIPEKLKGINKYFTKEYNTRYFDNEDLNSAYISWLEYKRNRKESLTLDNSLKLVEMINEKLNVYSCKSIIELIDTCIVSSYKRIVFELLEAKTKGYKTIKGGLKDLDFENLYDNI